jgi:DNA-binding transcriptional ArsR family regulator
MKFSEQIEEILVERAAKKLRLLTHPNRVVLIELLIKNKGMTVRDIYNNMNIPQPEASQHLTLLKDFGFIKKDRIMGKNIYSLNEKVFNNTLELVDKIVEEPIVDDDDDGFEIR